MKAHVKVVDLDGTADEIAKIIGGVTAHTLIEAQPVESPLVAPEDVATIEPAPKPDRAEVMERLAGALYDGAGVAPGELLEGGPFESPHDIPSEWRWLSGNGMTCHIRTQPGVAVAFCGASRKRIGARRLHDSEIPFQNTEVCVKCNDDLVKSRRAS